KRQNLAAQQGNATSAVRAVIVAVGSLSRVDVPPVGGISRPRNLQHFLERGRDYGAAGLPAVKERLFVDLFGGAGVTDEDDIDVPVAPDQEHVQQHKEPLGEVLHRFGHRS